MKTLQLCVLYGVFALLCVGTGSTLLVAQTKQDKKEYVSPTLPGGVPVFQPGQDMKKEDPKKEDPKKGTPPVTLPVPPPALKDKDAGPPAAVASDDGKMPLKFLRNKISDMEKGDTGYIPVTAVMVDSQRACYLDPDAVVAQTFQKNAPVVQVKRDEAGYHLALNEKATDHKWHAEDDAKMKNMTQVKTIKVLTADE